MTWKCHGLIFTPDTNLPWQRSHAQLPTPLCLEGSIYRVYFASRDASQRSHVGYFDTDLENPQLPEFVRRAPVLTPGPTGYFDQDGVYPSSVVRHEGKVFLYYIGWIKGHTPPLFFAAIGLAISDDGGHTFRRHSVAPILDRSSVDPCLVTGPFVLKLSDCWRMYYVSGDKWEQDSKGQYHSVYRLKVAESRDGIKWDPLDRVAIDLEGSIEKNISRTCISMVNGGFKAWFSSAGVGMPYRLGTATSSDGLSWTRENPSDGPERDPDGFDSEMQCYPSVVSYKGDEYMFYNGNNLGKAGVGMSVREVCGKSTMLYGLRLGRFQERSLT